MDGHPSINNANRKAPPECMGNQPWLDQNKTVEEVLTGFQRAVDQTGKTVASAGARGAVPAYNSPKIRWMMNHREEFPSNVVKIEDENSTRRSLGCSPRAGSSAATTCCLDKWSICKYLKTAHKAETDPLCPSRWSAFSGSALFSEHSVSIGYGQLVVFQLSRSLLLAENSIHVCRHPARTIRPRINSRKAQ